MERLKGIVQLVLAAVCLLIVVGTAVNLALIMMRPETISVANVMVGQGLLIVCLLAAARVLSRRGMSRIRSAAAGSSPAAAGRNPQKRV